MALLPVILDHVPTCQNGAPASLLTLPLCATSFLDHLVGQLSAATDLVGGEVLVMPTFDFDRDYEERIRNSTESPARVIRPQELTALLDGCEAADYLLLVGPARWPAGSFDWASIVRRAGDYRGATHVVAVGANVERTRERVERDGNGCVKRVQRHYDGVIWPQVGASGIVLSLAPAHAVGDIRFSSLAELRSRLSINGVLSQDLPVASDVIDLTEPAGVLLVNEKMTAQAVTDPSRPGFAARNAHSLIGHATRIDPSARLIGPVILHDRVTVEEGATIVGPTVVGAGSRIHRGATVAQAVLASETVVDADSTVSHRLVSGHYRRSSQSSEAPGEPLDEAAGAWEVDHFAMGAAASHDRSVRPSRQAQLAIKRAFDALFSAAALLVLSPLLIAVAVLVKLESRGPVFFLHRREQKGGTEFPCLKFRTMTADAHQQQRELYEQNEVDGPQFKLRHDPRVTRVGRWLRGTNIDELPQLINVLLGHMSLVGPRPSPFRENQICVPWRRARLSVRPGITGLWQVCRSEDRNAGDFHEWVFYDICYVRHLSIWLDVKIIVSTVLTLGGRWSVPPSWLIRGGGTGSLAERSPAA